MDAAIVITPLKSDEEQYLQSVIKESNFMKLSAGLFSEVLKF